MQHAVHKKSGFSLTLSILQVVKLNTTKCDHKVVVFAKRKLFKPLRQELTARSWLGKGSCSQLCVGNTINIRLDNLQQNQKRAEERTQPILLALTTLSQLQLEEGSMCFI